MYYFAYGSNLNAQAVAAWCKDHGHRPIKLKNGHAAVLDNYRMCFPIYSEYWGGGIADIVYDPGKYVAGVLFEMTEADMGILDLKVGRKLDESGKEIGIYRLAEVTVAPLGKKEPVKAYTYQGINVDKDHIPPTRHYMDLLLQGCFNSGLSIMWISYLKSFYIQTGRAPRPQI